MATMEHEEPDRVPITELSIDPLHIETLMFPKRFWSPEDKPALERIELYEHNAEVKVKCYDKLGMSLIVADVALHAPEGWTAKILSEREAKRMSRETRLEFTAGTFVDEWGRGTVFDKKCRVWVQQYGTLTSMEDWEKWAENFPDPYAKGRDADAKVMIKLAEEHDLAVAGLVREPFATLFECFPIEIFFRLLREHPDFIKESVRRYTDYNCEMCKIYGESGCDLVVSTGDLAHRDGPLARPRIYEEIFFPELHRQVEAAHKAGIKYVKHTDGDLTSLLPGLVNIAKVDGVHSLDPSAGVDIKKVKKRHGDKIFLMGNIAVDHLAVSSTSEIVEETKNCLREAAPDGGYILSSSNSWYTHCKLVNCLAMVRTAHKYGKYPLQIPA